MDWDELVAERKVRCKHDIDECDCGYICRFYEPTDEADMDEDDILDYKNTLLHAIQERGGSYTDLAFCCSLTI